MKFEIEGIDFELIKYEIDEKPLHRYYHNNTHILRNTNRNILIVATTHNNNYMAVGNLFEKMLTSNYSRNYKHNIDSKFLKLDGVFPIDYIFTKNNIEVTFSVDYIEGDLQLLNKQKMRKEKLKKLDNICQKYL